MSTQVKTSQLWESIRTSGLASADDCRKWAKGVSDAFGKAIVADPGELISALIRFGYLTPYQGNVILHGLSDPLVLEGIRIEESLEDQLGPFWYAGRAQDRLWVAAMSIESLASPGVRDWPPSMTWAEHHARLRAPELDVWNAPGATFRHLFASVEAWDAPSLAQTLDSGPLHSQIALRMVQDIANGLQALHGAGLIHGHLGLDSILMEADGAFRLRRDPFFPPRSPYRGESPCLIRQSHSRLTLAAPELALPDAAPTIASDLYALGCLWYRSATGRWPLEAGNHASPVAWYTLHGSQGVDVPQGFSEVAAKCLLHLLAKDPGARFASAQSFLQALRSDPQHASVSYASESGRGGVGTVVREPISGDASAVAAPERPPEQGAVATAKSTGGSKLSRDAHIAPKVPLEKQDVEKIVSDLGEMKSKLMLRQNTRQFIARTAVPKTNDDGTPTTAPDPFSESEAPASHSESSSDTRAESSPPSQTTLPSQPDARAKSKSTSVPKPPIQATERTAENVSSKKKPPSQPSGSTSPTTQPAAKPDAGSHSNEGDSIPTAIATPAVVAPSSSVHPAMPPVPPVPSVAPSRAKANRKSGAKKRSSNASKGSGVAKGKSKKKQRPIWVMPALIGGSCLLLGLLVFVLRSQTRGVVNLPNSPAKKLDTAANAPRKLPAVDPAPAPPVVDPIAERFEVRDDDGKHPWVPPSADAPFTADLLPKGVEAIAFLSGRAWQGQAPVAPIAAWWHSIQTEPRGTWESWVPVPAEAVEHIAVAWGAGSEPLTARLSVRITLKEPKKLSEAMSLGGWSAKKLASKLAGGQGSLWVREGPLEPTALVIDELSGSADAMTRHITLGPESWLESIAESHGAPFPLRRQMDVLCQATDRSADVTLLVAPSFLYGDGKGILGVHGPRILELMKSMVDLDVQAFLFRTQWNSQWYVEWRSLGNDLQAAPRNADSVKSSIETMSDRLESALVAQPADPYWRAIANRFPQMLRSVARYTRTTAESGQVVVNAYLPMEAMPNLVIGSWMAAQRDWNAAVASASPAKPSATSKSIQQWLDTPVSLRIEQDSLENLLQSIASELKEASGAATEPIPMAINGGAFQKDGITRNQQVRNFEFNNAPVKQVLTALARRANPVTTVQSPNERDQKVVWVVLDDPSTPSKKKLELTTRSWAEANGAALPDEFVEPRK